MSRASVRAGIGAYLGGTLNTQTRVYQGNTTFGVHLVRTAFPRHVPGDDFGLGDGVLSGSYVNVHVREQRETRITTGGGPVPPSGLKKIRYEVVLHIFHRSLEPHGEDAEDHLERVTEGLLQRIRADRTFGGVVFQAGEGDNTSVGSEDLLIGYGEPLDKDGGGRESYAGISLICLEYIQS